MAKSNARTIDLFDQDAGMLLLKFMNFILSHFGERHTKAHEDCATCEMWKHYDAVRELCDL